MSLTSELCQLLKISSFFYLAYLVRSWQNTQLLSKFWQTITFLILSIIHLTISCTIVTNICLFSTTRKQISLSLSLFNVHPLINNQYIYMHPSLEESMPKQNSRVQCIE
jgi:hypothetical protein